MSRGSQLRVEPPSPLPRPTLRRPPGVTANPDDNSYGPREHTAAARRR
jgi:hypothetical protein